jgi:hypothetical protein
LPAPFGGANGFDKSRDFFAERPFLFLDVPLPVLFDESSVAVFLGLEPRGGDEGGVVGNAVLLCELGVAFFLRCCPGFRGPFGVGGVGVDIATGSGLINRQP